MTHNPQPTGWHTGLSTMQGLGRLVSPPPLFSSSPFPPPFTCSLVGVDMRHRRYPVVVSQQSVFPCLCGGAVLRIRTLLARQMTGTDRCEERVAVVLGFGQGHNKQPFFLLHGRLSAAWRLCL